MTGPRKDSVKPETETAATYVVARGRTIKVGARSFGPGEKVDLPAADLPHLQKAGFVVLLNDEPASASGVRVGVLQIRGGQRPGAKVA